MILLHDNARSHVAKVVKDTLSALQWEIVPHVVYSSNYAPSDYLFYSTTLLTSISKYMKK